MPRQLLKAKEKKARKNHHHLLSDPSGKMAPLPKGVTRSLGLPNETSAGSSKHDVGTETTKVHRSFV